MKNRIPPILSLWFLITIALAIFVGISFSDDISIGNHTLSKGYFPETLLAKEETLKIDTITADTVSVATKEIVIEPDTTVHNVLIFGDSMTHNLAMSIARYGTKNNYKVTGVTWESSSIPGWRSSDKIRKYISQTKPDFIIVSLGSNEMELKNFDRRIPDVEKIVEQIDSIPFIWVGPPLWKEDKGVYAMLEEALPKGVLFKTDQNIEIPRGGDHIHPSRHGAEVWADTLMRWIAHSPHPILTEVPDSGTSTKGHKFIYLHPND
ncbi:MAG: SGNH/GDSL hydrolase family protein [Muribaculaceae bacterium]|nr:SGNH/GDSL hydrolase family protein [Muribaculaceae bacterium]